MKPVLLIADDSEFVRQALAAGIRGDERVQVIEATNGKEALEALAADGEIRAVVIDVKLRLLDGPEVLRRISRRRRQTLFIVAVGDRGPALDSCRELGADEVMTKPLDVEALRGLIQRAMSRPVGGAPSAPGKV